MKKRHVSFNRFPVQIPFEPREDSVTYMGLQPDISPELIEQHKKRQQTIAEHRKRIKEYLNLKPWKSYISAVFIQTFLDSVFCSGFIVMATSLMLYFIFIFEEVAIGRDVNRMA